MLVNANWGMIWNKVNFVSGSNNNDDMGMGLDDWPRSFKLHDHKLAALRETVTQLSTRHGRRCLWTKAAPGCCIWWWWSRKRSRLLDTKWNRRGMYYVTNGGGGVVIKASGRWYRQGGIIPMLEDKTCSSILGTVEMGDIFP